jgi:hypothetical protein
MRCDDGGDTGGYLAARTAAIAPAQSAITNQNMYYNAFDVAGSPVSSDATAGFLCAAAVPISSAASLIVAQVILTSSL